MSSQNQQNSSEYSEENIGYLNPRNHVRLRPGMYIGGIDKKALHQMIWEVLDDAISEFENTSYNEIIISLLPDKWICVADNGKGISIRPHKTLHVSWLEAYLSNIGRWSLKRNAPEDLSKTYESFFGVGLPIANALSVFLIAEVKRDGFLWRQTYKEGLNMSKLEQLRPLDADESTGTSITFRPDFTIMEKNHFDFELIAKRCQELAYLLPQLRFTVQDKRKTKRKVSFHYPQGLVEWVKAIEESEAVMVAPLSISYDCLYTQGKPYTVKVRLALKWLWSDEIHQVASYVNTIATSEGGKHVDGLKLALVKQFPAIRWNSLGAGLVGIIHILHPDPQFESQTRIRLLNDDVAIAVEEAIEALFAAHPEAKAAIQAHFSQR